MKLENIIEKLPKVDLHVHLDGSVKPETVFDLALDQGITLPTNNIKELSGYLKIEGDCDSLIEYLQKFDFVSQVLHTKEALERVAYEVVEQAYEENCKYIEVRFGPQLHTNKGLSLEEVIYSVIKGLKRGEKRYGVQANVIACCLRHHSTEENKEVIRAASAFHGKGLVGVDLAGDEATYPAHLFREVFELAKQKAIPVTIHAGEAAGPENIREAITNLGASRIGHGVRLKDDPELLNYVLENCIPLEMCPISNIQTKASASWDRYPIRYYFDRGLMITVNTDNMTVSNTCLTKELLILVEKFDFTLMEIGQVIMNSIDASFLDARAKKKLKNKFLAEYKRLEMTSQQVI
ncbi:adenosine deaminase [Aquibacillus koreensis]|uniref:Adenosine deaminase n=1 Tax=Aquibacillus koreensis TaxID=279446 RepID=A0A9X3WM31_9BACI|nr:adenosine deaminase [Aquibacillus koreensis]MCT2536346.1 adenosine deaminase [Aquibacillus koreensis]MDC3421303.1 adenosine deaminase [Aquibacillus koreensis]